MNTTLTKEEQEIADKASIAYANRLKAEGKQPNFAGIWDAAVAFALSGLFPSRAEKFAEWVDDKMYWRVKSRQWLDNNKIVAITTEQLYTLFEEYLKQQEG